MDLEECVLVSHIMLDSAEDVLCIVMCVCVKQALMVVNEPSVFSSCVCVFVCIDGC